LIVPAFIDTFCGSLIHTSHNNHNIYSTRVLIVVAAMVTNNFHSWK